MPHRMLSTTFTTYLATLIIFFWLSKQYVNVETDLKRWCVFPLRPSQTKPFTFQRFIIWYLSCYSLFIPANYWVSGFGGICNSVFIFFLPLPAKLSTCLTFDVCENEASRILIISLEATKLLHGQFSLF